MAYTQTFENVSKADLIDRAIQFKHDGWRLIQISATFKGSYDLLYSFEKDYNMINLRVLLPDGEWVDSLSSIYSYAYLYENEMRDLFGIEVHGMNVDFEGKLYQTAEKTPFHVKTVEGEALK